ncbi:hypothetical protein [Chloroflexus islandicus]|uniref:hypothetical protein n=1 Tax=Chloroflexus islandicus TaxID=1707952 RepID=UPI0009EE5F59|nr:hypothetical protein [Chloroflexus islandicus]
MHSQKLLFSDRNLYSVMEAQKAKMFQEIDTYPANQLLNTSIDDLAKYFAAKFEIVPIRIIEDQISVDQQETKRDVSQDPLRFISDRDRPFYISETLIILYIPFEGEPDIFMYRPSTITLNPPRGFVNGNTLELSIFCTDHDVQSVKREIDRLLGSIRQYLIWITSDLTSFNATLKDVAQQHIEVRRQKLLKDQGLIASLGFPLRKRPDTPATYAVSTVRRKAIPKPPPAHTTAYVPEPAIEMAEYEHILSIIQSTATMLERSPQTFRDMDEENLRDQFLVPLNSHYEGQTTGETFNASGKTDILIRDGDRSVFIAECKIWRGPKSFSSAIDQLLGYATWRDTKTAILIFNHNTKLSDVLAKIPNILKSHSNWKRMMDFTSPTGFRCILAHKDDPNREIILTVLVFEVPK